ncbi:MAG: hypothetical protein ACR2LQ_03160 [Acidimicrobiales bacterium]
MPGSSLAPSSLTSRALGALILGALASVLGGLMLGEYQFSGLLPYGAGLLFGLVIGELVAELGRQRSWPVALLAAPLVAGGLGLAVRISTGEGLEPFPIAGWIAIALGVLAVTWRTGPSRRRTH